MPEALTARLEEVTGRIRTAPRLLLCSDFDGTLVPIKERPTECFLDAAVGRTLAALSACRNVAVGIVSGRELKDLRARVRVEGIAYAGNHGLEIEGPGFAFREPTADTIAGRIQGVVRELTPTLAAIPGAWVQDKGLSVSVHYRQVDPTAIPGVVEAVRAASAAAVDAGQVVLRNGKMVMEIRPAVDWHKGKAVGWLAERMSPGDAAPLVIYIGDDATDEDAFAAFPEAVTICVGERPGTAANYAVEGPADIHAFLTRVLDVRGASPDLQPGHPLG